MTPTRLYLLGGLWAASLLWTYNFADKNATNAFEAAKVPAMEKQVEHHNEKAAAGNGVDVAAAARATKTNANFQRIDDELYQWAKGRAADDDCSIDAVGLRLWREANRNTEAEALPASQPDEGLRPLGRPNVGSDDRPGQGPQGHGQEVSPVPRAAAGPGEVVGAKP